MSGSAALTIVPSASWHVSLLAPRLRKIDQSECRAMGHAPEAALRQALSLSSCAWTALVDGQPEAMFGLAVASVLGGEGIAWFLGSDAVARYPRALLRLGPEFLATMQSAAPSIGNWVSSDNHQAIRLLKHWGFDVDHKQRVIGGLAFVPFRKGAL